MSWGSGLDSYDRKILRILLADGRKSWRDISEEIGLSLTPTLRRVRRLEAEGYILGYAALLDESRLIGKLEALISITLERQSEEAITAFEQDVVALEEVTDCFQMTGDYDYLLRVVVGDLEHYQAMMADLMRVRMVARINSSFVLKSVMQRSLRVIRLQN